MYGGGGSPSSVLFPSPSLLGSEKEALVSATTDDEGAESSGSSVDGGGANAGSEPEPDSETLGWVQLIEGEAEKREENGGGPTERELDADASDGECGGGAE